MVKVYHLSHDRLGSFWRATPKGDITLSPDDQRYTGSLIPRDSVNQRVECKRIQYGRHLICMLFFLCLELLLKSEVLPRAISYTPYITLSLLDKLLLLHTISTFGKPRSIPVPLIASFNMNLAGIILSLPSGHNEWSNQCSFACFHLRKDTINGWTSKLWKSYYWLPCSLYPVCRWLTSAFEEWPEQILIFETNESGAESLSIDWFCASAYRLRF